MKRLATVGLLAMFAATSVLAQTEPPADPPHTTKQPPHRALRLGAELVGGSLAALAGGFGGFLLVCGITANPQGSCGSPASYGAGLGAGVGLWAGVMVAGYLLDGNGSMLWTFVGESLGLGAGLLAETALNAAGYVNLAVVTLIILPVAGALLGYETSSVPSRYNQQHSSPDGARFSATVLVSGRGTPLMGLAGAF